MSLRLSPTFRDALAGADRTLAGMWVCSGSPLVAEICAGSGLDWLLIDMEHSPNGLESVLAQLQAVAAYPVTPLVLTFQRVLYGEYGDTPVIPAELGFTWYLRNLGIVTAGVLILLAIALRVFSRLEGNLAEEL